MQFKPQDDHADKQMECEFPAGLLGLNRIQLLPSLGRRLPE